ncbi:MAG: class I SAM-dependent methyltransferase [bacterium]|nr:class I SAM-dependent methyltransferase [bacterium]MDA1024634.1 class I SAM-dependent methyltransferase [bacterium]
MNLDDWKRYFGGEDRGDGDKRGAYERVVEFLAPHRQLVKELVELSQIENGMRIVDTGCGVGAVVRELIATGKIIDIVGLDFNDLAIARAKQRFPNVDFYVQDLSMDSWWKNKDIEEGSADIVTSSNLLYALPEVKWYLKGVHALLKSEGRFVLTNPRGKKPDPAPIFKEQERYMIEDASEDERKHWSEVQNNREVQLVKGINQNIAASSSMQFFDDDELFALFAEHGFSVKVSGPSYEGSNITIMATKQSLS